MKTLQKNFYWFICTVVLAIIVFYGLIMTTAPQVRFSISSDGQTEEISIYESEDGNSYVFLPSYANMEDVRVALSSSHQISLGGINLSNGMTCELFMLETGYPLEINGQQETVLWFYQSANVATMYIETSSGGMDTIYADKAHEENASIALHTPTGDIEYIDRNCLLKGRGNSTWKEEKKPFLLKLSSEAGLLGMGEDTDWILLANSLDESNLHNKLVLDMADKAIDEWTPRCEYVDVYLNGQYNGLYLLAEKVESGPNRLNIDTGTGDFLCTVDFSIRAETLAHPFYTENGRMIAICEPNHLSSISTEQIMQLVNQQEQILLSQGDLTQSQLVNLDSWIRKYLVDEIAANTDADLSSSYFYYSDGVFYGGPVWDYDMAFGNTIQNHYPQAFIAKNYLKYSGFNSVYYNALFGNASFVKRMSEVFENEFLPILNDMIDHEIQDTADRIALAANMNQIRWPIQVSEHPELQPWSRYINTADSIIHYLEERTEFLSDVLVHNKSYCTLRFEHPSKGFFWTVSIPYGSVLKNTDVVNEPLYAEVYSNVWLINGTDTLFDPSKPITSDITAIRHVADEENISTFDPSKPITSDITAIRYVADEKNISTRDYITFASIVMLGILMLGIVCVDHRQRRQERRYVDENGRTKISP